MLVISKQFVDENGNPAGGHSYGTGFAIAWQNGPLGRGDERQEPNGAFVETVLTSVIDRMEFYQESKFKCDHNERALHLLKEAMGVMSERTKERDKREVEGTHAI